MREKNRTNNIFWLDIYLGEIGQGAGRLPHVKKTDGFANLLKIGVVRAEESLVCKISHKRQEEISS
jgi:hypothetical protein